MANASAIILDFDTSKPAGATADAGRPPSQARARQQILARLATVLQTSIELPEILRLFFLECSRCVPLHGLSYHQAACNYEFTHGDTSGHSVNYRLQTREDYLGEVSFHRTQGVFIDTELAMLESLLAALVYPLRNGLRYLEAVRSALTDALTGVGNRVSMDTVLAREYELALRYEQPLSVLMIDLDHFKRINDTFGHSAGDYVIKTVAKTLRATSRNADMTFRYGGEEFVLLLTKTDATGASISAERLRHTIEQLGIVHNGRRIPVTVSIGIASLTHGEALHRFLDRADTALYEAKASGRNRSVSASITAPLVGDGRIEELAPRA